MGYGRVFWIKEEPIRRYITEYGRDSYITEEVGSQVLSLSVGDSYQEILPEGSELPLFETPSVFFQSGSFHSTDFRILFWTGNRLCPLPDADFAMFDSLCKLTKVIGNAYIHPPISEEEFQQGFQRQDDFASNMDVSLYWILEDFSRNFKRLPKTECPYKEVGEAVLNLMGSNWPRSASILNHGNPISRCCTFSRPESAVLVWSLNCLRLISEIDDEEIQAMREFLARE